MKSVSYLLLFLTTPLLFLSCEDDDPVIPNEEELITTLIYNLVPVGGGSSVTMTFRDLDGDGGDPPVVTGGTLEANTSYSGTIGLHNEIEVPAGDIAVEVRAEDEVHQLFFSPEAGLDTQVAYADQDENGNPLGLVTQLNTGDISQGSLRIILRHEPDKFALGVKDGDISNAGGETDIEVVFDVTIE